MKEPEYRAEQFNLFKPPKGSAIAPQVRAPFHSEPHKYGKELASPYDRRMSGPPPEERYTIYTDGACYPNPGSGGWCAIVLHRDQKLAVLSGNAPQTTNNQMELQAIVAALEWLDPGDGATIVSDSQYCVRGCAQWRFKWKKHHWRVKNGGSVLNADLWQRIHELCRPLFVDFKWVRGHNGNKWNEECDRIAVACKHELTNGFSQDHHQIRKAQ